VADARVEESLEGRFFHSTVVFGWRLREGTKVMKAKKQERSRFGFAGGTKL